MIEVAASAILIPENRFRRDFDEKKLLELEASILRIGLLNPITVEQSNDPSSWILRAGERRFRVLQKILAAGNSFRLGDTTYSGTTLPAINYAELSPLQRLEIEVEENVVRSDFVWQERTRALTALHQLRKEQNPEQSLSATASEVLGKPAVGAQQMVISNALIVARYLDDPDVAKAKNEVDALKVIKKKTEIAHRARLAINFDPNRTPHLIIKGNSKEQLRLLPEGKYDVILTDPPYGIRADGFGDMAGTGHDYKDTQKGFDEILSWLPDELNRVAKKSAHCYLFCDIRQFEKLHTFMVLAGWTVFNTPLVWDKCGIGMLPFPHNGPRRTHEYILYAWKGDRRTLLLKNDVVRVPAVKKLLHGAQKPVALYCDLLSRSANPGDCVLDCFGGSGTILPACNNMRLTATYIEREEDAYLIACERAGNTGFDDGSEEDDGIEISL